MNKIYRRNRIDLPIGVKIIAYLILFLSGPILIQMMMDTFSILSIFNEDFLTALILFIIFPLPSILILAKKILGLDILSFVFIALFFVLIIYSIVNNIKPKLILDIIGEDCRSTPVSIDYNIKPKLISVLISTIPFLTGIYLLSRRKIILTIIKHNKEIAKSPPLPIDYRILARIIAYSTMFYPINLLVFYFSIIIINGVQEISTDSILILSISLCLIILPSLMLMGKKFANYLLAILYIIFSGYLLYNVIFKSKAYILLSIILLFFGTYLIFRTKSLNYIKSK